MQTQALANGGPPRDPVSTKVRRRRSVKACCSCRERKVRCDVLKCGNPCTNCRLDNIECLVPEVDRRRKGPNKLIPGAAREPTAKNRLSPHTIGMKERFKVADTNQPSDKDNSSLTDTNQPSDKDNSSLTMPDHANHWINNISSAGLGGVPGETPAILNHSQDSGIHAERIFEPSLIYETMDLNEGREQTRSPTLTPFVNNSSASTRAYPVVQYQQRWYHHAFSVYLEPPPNRILEEDIEYLSAKGALFIPPDEFRNALLESYIKFVHPYLPILDLEDLLWIIDGGRRKRGKISLLLFQCIMFAGTAFVDTAYLHQAAFTTRKAARRAFFCRAKLLYELDYEQDKISLIQSFLLLSYWFESPDDHKGTSHWLALAISLSQVVGLHRNSNTPKSIWQRHLWKRIWWSCFMRDRLVSLAARLPTLIKLEDCNTPMLTVDDFEIIRPRINSSLNSGDILGDINVQYQLAVLCIEKVKLCVHIGRAISDHDSFANRMYHPINAASSVRTRMILLAATPDLEKSETKRYGDELHKWALELPDEAIYHRPTSDSFDKGLVLHQALLQMLYYTTTIYTLNWPPALDFISFQRSVHSHDAELREILREKARLAALEITKISHDLLELGLVKYLPTSGVTAMLIATIVHLGVKSDDKEVREASIRGFTEGYLVMQDLRDNYFSASYAAMLLERAIKKTSHKPLRQIVNKGTPVSDVREDAESTNEPIMIPDLDPSVASNTMDYNMNDPLNGMLLSADNDLSLSNAFPSGCLDGSDPFDYSLLPFNWNSLLYAEEAGLSTL